MSNMNRLLVLAETDGVKILPSTLSVLTFAQRWSKLTGDAYDILVIGDSELESLISEWDHFGAATIYGTYSPELLHCTADKTAAIILQVMKMAGCSSLAGPSTTYGRDILPRAAGLADLPMVTDVMSIDIEETHLIFKRPTFAGNVIATVKISGHKGIFSVRGTAFEKPEIMDAVSNVETIALNLSELPQGSKWISLDSPEQTRPDVTNARVVVTGGRPLRDAETYEKLIGGLADKLGGATGATRAAVDSGIAPNESQVGQTGKVVAPELYIAAGVSGSVQHMAGMKESKVIVAVNTDPDAPIFDIADYGLIADLHTAIPELISKL